MIKQIIPKIENNNIEKIFNYNLYEKKTTFVDVNNTIVGVCNNHLEDYNIEDLIKKNKRLLKVNSLLVFSKLKFQQLC